MKNNYEYEQDEPFGWYDGMGFSTNKKDFGKAISTATPLYTHPAPSWQGLSDDEMVKIIEACEDKFDRHLLGGIMIARAIEQALKEKNT